MHGSGKYLRLRKHRFLKTEVRVCPRAVVWPTGRAYLAAPTGGTVKLITQAHAWARARRCQPHFCHSNDLTV